MLVACSSLVVVSAAGAERSGSGKRVRLDACVSEYCISSAPCESLFCSSRARGILGATAWYGCDNPGRQGLARLGSLLLLGLHVSQSRGLSGANGSIVFATGRSDDATFNFLLVRDPRGILGDILFILSRCQPV